MGKKSKNDRLGVVFSTNPDYSYEYNDGLEQDTPEPGEQRLRVRIEKKGRKGKPVCVVTGFIGTESDLADLAKTLKVKCGVGGSAKEGEIILQGTMKDRVIGVLKDLGYSDTR